VPWLRYIFSTFLHSQSRTASFWEGSISSTSGGGTLAPPAGSFSGGAGTPGGGVPPAVGGMPSGGPARGHHDAPCRPNIRFTSLTSRSRNVLQPCPAKYRVMLLVYSLHTHWASCGSSVLIIAVQPSVVVTLWKFPEVRSSYLGRLTGFPD